MNQQIENQVNNNIVLPNSNISNIPDLVQPKINNFMSNDLQKNTNPLDSELVVIKEKDKDKRNLFYERIDTKLELRKINLKEELARKKQKTSEVSEGLLISPEKLDLSENDLKANFNSILEIFDFLSFSYQSKKENLFKYGIYILRQKMCDSMLSPEEINLNTTNFFSLYEVLEIYYTQKKEISVVYEIIWIISNMFFYISEDPKQTIMFSSKLCAILGDILMSNPRPEFVCTIFQLCGNAISVSSENRTAIYKSKINTFIQNVFKGNNSFDLQVANSIIWYLSQTIRLKPELSFELVSIKKIIYIVNII